MKSVEDWSRPADDNRMINKTLFATAVAGGALLAVVAPASAGEHDRSAADILCAAPWQWNGPLALLHGDHAPGHVACGENTSGHRDAGITVLDSACVAPWQWNGPLEIFTVTPFYAVCNGNSSG